jgi:hypothetical protein
MLVWTAGYIRLCIMIFLFFFFFDMFELDQSYPSVSEVYVYAGVTHQ